MSQKIETSVKTISPEAAQKLLSSNTHNRDVSSRKVATYTLAIQRGEWKFNGEAIKIADDGTILDGQHRLLAVVKAGQPIETLVITGLSADTQETMDTGKSRTLADVLKLRGEQNCSTLASILAGIIRSDQWGIRVALSAGSTSYIVTNAQAIRRLETEPSIRDIPSIVAIASRRAYLPKRILGTLYYRFAQIDQDDADGFIEALATQANLPDGSPIIALMAATKSVHDDTKGTRNSTYLSAITIKAWNKYREGADIRQLKFRPGGHNPETFPIPA